jgi:mono/diheme cytochrome c family protein
MNKKLSTACAAMSVLAIQTHAIAADTQNQRGHEVFTTWCQPCHAPNSATSPRLAGTMVLEQKYKGTKPAALEDRTDLNPSMVAAFVRNGVNSMPFFRKTEVSDADLKAVGEYLSHKQSK